MHDPIGHYNREEALLIGRELEKLNMPIAATETDLPPISDTTGYLIAIVKIVLGAVADI